MSWQQEFKDAFKTTDELAKFVDAPVAFTNYPIYIPKSFAKKVKADGVDGPLWRQFIPSENENELSGLVDPIGDNIRAQGRGIVHRYQNRLLFFPTSICPVQCRYCFRKNELHDNDPLFRPTASVLQEYLAAHPEINEVIFSGGDPLVLSDDVICRWLDLIAEYKNIRFIRFHTRMPVIVPSRMNEGLLDCLVKYQSRFAKIIFVFHTNHASELDEEVEQSARFWNKYPFEYLTQSVLLHQVNDSVETLAALFERIIELGWRPYYLHHPDQARGAMHFDLAKNSGISLMNELRQVLSGWALPQYVFDGPSANGKRPVCGESPTLGHITTS